MAKDITLAPVDKYKAESEHRSPEETVLAEGRVGQTDQIEDYHEVHPTLDTTGPEHDPALRDRLLAEAQKAPSKTAVKEAAKEVPPVVDAAGS